MAGYTGSVGIITHPWGPPDALFVQNGRVVVPAVANVNVRLNHYAGVLEVYCNKCGTCVHKVSATVLHAVNMYKVALPPHSCTRVRTPQSQPAQKRDVVRAAELLYQELYANAD